jgi:hypothetical protein
MKNLMTAAAALVLMVGLNSFAAEPTPAPAAGGTPEATQGQQTEQKTEQKAEGKKVAKQKKSKKAKKDKSSL